MVFKKIQHSLKQISPFKKVIVGVSGGADSMALAHVLMKLGYEITITHLNHGLRGKESDADAKFVQTLAQKWKVPFVIYKVKLRKKGNLENQARMIRYDFLEKVRQARKAKFIAVAHHLDDQIETILMHMQRGAGLRGLCGIKMQNGSIIRPFLNVRKQDLINYVKKEKLDYQTDKSNFDKSFKRNYLRHSVIPKLKKEWKALETDLMDLSESAQKRLKKIEENAKKWIQKAVKNNQFKRSDFLELPSDVQSEVLFLLTGYQDIYSKQINELKSLIKKGITGKQKKVGDLTFQTQYDRVNFYKTRITTTILRKQKLGKREIKWGDWKLKYKGSDTLYVRVWQKGDRFKPAGMKGTKKLQDFFVDQKIPKTERHQIPIIVDKNNQILSIGDLRFDSQTTQMNLKQKLVIQKIN